MGKITRMQAYYTGAVPDSDQNITKDGLSFTGSGKQFLLISNHGIGEELDNEKCYFEFTVNTITSNSSYVYMPLYVGIHKEPTVGILANDFCLCGIFYDASNLKYTVRERYNWSGIVQNTPIPMTSIFTRPPIINDVIGVAIDYPNNLISIYVNGNLLYNYTPSLFTMNTEDAKFYLAIYSQYNINITGSVNFGRKSIDYLPSGYNTVFYYHNYEAVYTPPNLLTPNYNMQIDSITGEIESTSIKGDGSQYLITNEPLFQVNSDCSYYMDNSSTGIIFSNLPVPAEKKIYIELYVRDGLLSSSYLGIPVSFGLTSDTSSFGSASSKFINIPLYHNKGWQYKYFEKELPYGHVQSYIIEDVLTSIANEEGKYIGILIDSEHGTITVWVDSVLFYIYHLNTKMNSDMYFYIKNDSAYSNYVKGTINLGNDEEKTNKQNVFRIGYPPTGSMSLWHYYNKLAISCVKDLSHIDGEVEVIECIDKVSAWVNGILNVETTESIEHQNSRGINHIMSTYNYVDDVIPHNEEQIYNSPVYINNLIASYCNGYFPDKDK